MRAPSLAAAALGTLVMAAAILAAWGFELVGGFEPCPLCLEQRVPYYIALPLALAGLFLLRRATTPGRLLLLAAAACMLWTAALGGYHAGAEWGFWPGPRTCGGGVAVDDAADLLARLKTAQVRDCSIAAGRFLGLSFAGWNVLAALVAAALLAAGARGRRRAT